MADDPLLQASVQVHGASISGLVPARDIANIWSVERYAGTAYTIRPRSRGLLLLCTSSSPVSILVPPASSTPFYAGPVATIVQLGSGQVSFAGIGGVTLNDSPETWNLAKQFALATLIATDVADEFVLAGYLEAA
jgi:hypothetical protein